MTSQCAGRDHHSHTSPLASRLQDWEDDKVTGFGQLSVLTNAAYNDSAQLYAAGMLEGALTQTRIAQQYFNVQCVLGVRHSGPLCRAHA